MGARPTPLAWRSFRFHTPTMLSSIGGVAFAVVLMFVEMGYLNGLFDSHTRVIDWMDADLLIVNVDKAAVLPRLPFDRRHLSTARGARGVAHVSGLRLDEMRSMFKNLETHEDYPMLVYGCDPDAPPFTLPGMRALTARLKVLDTVLLDERSKDLYGAFGVGDEVEIADRRLRVVGTFALGPDFRADGNAIVSERTFLGMYARPGSNEAELVEFGLVGLAEGADRETVRDELALRLPEAVAVVTPEEMAARIRRFWGQSKPVGFVFGLGLVVGFLIGMSICYQILYVDVTNHLAQYATLKAIGYGEGYLVKVALQQGLYLAGFGFALGLAVSRAAYAAIEAYTQVPMFFTPVRVAVVLVLTLTMCLASGYIAIGRALDADPAEVF